MSDDLHPIHKAFADALNAGAPAVIDLGRTVLCDACDTDLTDDPRSGGIMFGSYAYGPCCVARQLEGIRVYGEEHFITGRCPTDVSFADWIRDTVRGPRGNTISITPGSPFGSALGGAS